MWTIALAFIKKINPLWYLIVSLGVLVGFQQTKIVWKNHTITTLETEVQTKKSEIELQTTTINNLTASRQQCMTLVSAQNSGIEAVTKATDKVKQEIARVAEENKKKDETIKKLISDVQVAPVPKDCEGAMKNLKGFSDDFFKDWNKK